MDPAMIGLIVAGVEAIGPAFLRLVSWILEGADPIAELAKERVGDILADPLLCEQALAARKVALAIQQAGAQP